SAGAALAASADREPHDAARPPGALRARHRVEREQQPRELGGLALLAAIPEQGRHGFCIGPPPPAHDHENGEDSCPKPRSTLDSWPFSRLTERIRTSSTSCSRRLPLTTRRSTASSSPEPFGSQPRRMRDSNGAPARHSSTTRGAWRR